MLGHLWKCDCGFEQIFLPEDYVDSGIPFCPECEKEMMTEDYSEYSCCERGNILFTNGSQFVAYFLQQAPSVWLEVTWSPENYPALNLNIVEKTVKSLNKHLDSLIDEGWKEIKRNI